MTLPLTIGAIAIIAFIGAFVSDAFFRNNKLLNFFLVILYVSLIAMLVDSLYEQYQFHKWLDTLPVGKP